jgi:hypothetical protein
MAINFSKLKDPKLLMTDKLTFGKLSGCRVCDVIQDHYEYLIWCEKQGFVKFSQEVTDCILEQANFEKWVAPDEHTSQDDVSKQHDFYEVVTRGASYEASWEDDIPF